LPIWRVAGRVQPEEKWKILERKNNKRGKVYRPKDTRNKSIGVIGTRGVTIQKEKGAWKGRGGEGVNGKKVKAEKENVREGSLVLLTEGRRRNFKKTAQPTLKSRAEGRDERRKMAKL